MAQMGAEGVAAAFHHQALYLTYSEALYLTYSGLIINSAFYIPAMAVSEIGNEVICSN